MTAKVNIRASGNGWGLYLVDSDGFDVAVDDSSASKTYPTPWDASVAWGLLREKLLRGEAALTSLSFFESVARGEVVVETLS